jgi:hypothetical protein
MNNTGSEFTNVTNKDGNVVKHTDYHYQGQ